MNKLILACVWQINLDLVWSSSSFTMHGNKDKVIKMLKYSSSVWLKRYFGHEGPLPVMDYCGYEVAVNMLIYSRKAGTRCLDHLQFDIICNL